MLTLGTTLTLTLTQLALFGSHWNRFELLLETEILADDDTHDACDDVDQPPFPIRRKRAAVPPAETEVNKIEGRNEIETLLSTTNDVKESVAPAEKEKRNIQNYGFDIRLGIQYFILSLARRSLLSNSHPSASCLTSSVLHIGMLPMPAILPSEIFEASPVRV